MLAEYVRNACEDTPHNVVEFILKDTRTCESRAERFEAWTRIASEIVRHY
ncbi:MAG: hypothetical protein R6X16_06030 [Anaerolineae bacterium]